MAEIFTMPNNQDDKEKPLLDSFEICERLDEDQELALLLGKTIHENSDPSGESIWPSNMIDYKDNTATIDGRELDEMIDDVVASIQEENDLPRILKVRQLSAKKSEIIQRIYEILKEIGIKHIEVINAK